MNELNESRFGEFFESLWDRQPFAWQKALAARVLEFAPCPRSGAADQSQRGWPEAIALPTASGKTACLDIAVYALAAQAELLAGGEHLTAPRRIFFVVDRRVIVDEAYHRARSLSAKLRSAQQGILREIADRLRILGGNDEPLAVFELRGGMLRSEAWARSPLQPTVIASTVDQLGSRLLFRAYGSGAGMWPILAGLAGNDSLILLDEAHCARPFLETLQAIRKYRGFAEEPLPAPFHVVVMSATPPEGLQDVFRDESEEPRDPHHPLGKRQLANKPARLIAPVKVKGKDATSVFPRAMADQAEDLASNHAKVGEGHRAVVIFVNRVATAREVHRLLAEKHGERAILLTGRMRPIDRDDIVLQRLSPLSAEGSNQRQLDAPVFVVTTQTLEVGADLDFDSLATECASLDALRQRFGRLNRMGRPIEANGAILVRPEQRNESEGDPVYGSALAKTWLWLNQQASEAVIDLGIASLAPSLDTAPLDELNAPATSAPVMFPAHVDCWVQTTPEPAPTPDVSLFLRGPKEESGDMQVCWRADLDLDSESGANASLDVLAQVQPSSAECLPVPIGLFRRWLFGENPIDESGDVEGTGEFEVVVERGQRRVIRWRGREQGQDKSCATSDPKDFRPGDVAVIPATEKGWEALGDLVGRDSGLPVFDWGDRGNALTHGRAALRLNPAVIREWPECSARNRLTTIVEDGKSRYDEAPDELLVDLQDVLSELATQVSVTSPWLARLAGHLAMPNSRVKLGRHPVDGFILSSKKPLPTEDIKQHLFSDEDDSSSSGTVPVSLKSHVQGVATYALRFAIGLALPPDLCRAIESAGRLHDLGKADPRFQSLLRGGNPWGTGSLLAKSSDLPQTPSVLRKAREAAGYPKGARHELLSARLAESVPELLPKEDSLRDLVLHLIASHHGRCRPFAPVVIDENPVEVRLEFNGRSLSHSSATLLERLDSGVPDRFWRLTRRYGWWGLAWLEAILRLADHRRSEAEERGLFYDGERNELDRD